MNSAMDKMINKADTLVTTSPNDLNKDAARPGCIYLYSLNKSMQTALLADLIGQTVGAECKVTHNQSRERTATGLDSSESTILPAEILGNDLILVDCQGHDIQNLRALISDINDLEENVNAALLNAEHDSQHEELLDWPCISGIFFSDSTQDQLIRGLQSLLRGEYWVPRRLLHHFLEKNRRAPSSKRSDIKLTKRERQILKLIKDGATNMDIASALDVSEHTVKSHLYNVYKKIGVRNRLEASNWVRDLEDL